MAMSFFPFNGSVSLAVEVLRSLNTKLAPAVLIKDFHVKAGLVIEEDERIDLTTGLCPAPTTFFMRSLVRRRSVLVQLPLMDAACIWPPRLGQIIARIPHRKLTRPIRAADTQSQDTSGL